MHVLVFQNISQIQYHNWVLISELYRCEDFAKSQRPLRHFQFDTCAGSTQKIKIETSKVFHLPLHSIDSLSELRNWPLCCSTEPGCRLTVAQLFCLGNISTDRLTIWKRLRFTEWVVSHKDVEFPNVFLHYSRLYIIPNLILDFNS